MAAIIATPQSVEDYLVKLHNFPRPIAAELVKKHAALVEKANRVGSYSYYPGDKICRAEDHDCEVSACPDPDEAGGEVHGEDG